ncbi:hypothetical protein CFR76_01805 [Komagataeibacter swingsii]|uniref:Uncharacterized protein n=2 Tax=Komagataeibacter swingsii TaxID=215220 RepID=A0A2V4RNB1_9PROT|nr:hypothetical protein CFR76_01805 [Komagataeibacter swingsii]
MVDLIPYRCPGAVIDLREALISIEVQDKQMPVRREFPAWHDLLKPIHDLIELGYEDGDLSYGGQKASFCIVRISLVAFICEAALSPPPLFSAGY